MKTLPATLLFILLAASYAFATDYDLTANLGTSVTDTYLGQGIIYQTVAPQPTGTGFIDSFVEIGQPGGSPAKAIVEAYNTTVNNVWDNGSSNTFNHAISISNLATVTKNGIAYYQFNLDINQTADNPLLSLSDVQVFLLKSGNPNVESTDMNDQVAFTDYRLVYRLDDVTKDAQGNILTGSDDTIGLNYNLNGSGSGMGDMLMLIPQALFNTANGYTSVILYSKFGIPNPNNDGFEEWFLCRQSATSSQACGSTDGTTGNTASGQAPEPAAFMLLSAGLLYVSRFRRNARQN